MSSNKFRTSTGKTSDETKDPTIIDEVFGAYNSKNLPERKLIAAVLERAFRDLQLDGKSNAASRLSERPARASAYTWFFMQQEGDIERPFTLAWICDVLNLDLGCIMERVKYLYETEWAEHREKRPNGVRYSGQFHRVVGLASDTGSQVPLHLRDPERILRGERARKSYQPSKKAKAHGFETRGAGRVHCTPKRGLSGGLPGVQDTTGEDEPESA